MIGFAARMMARGVFGAAKLGFSAAREVSRAAYTTGPGMLKDIGNIGLFAIRHPYGTIGAIGAGAYLYNSSGSPYSSPSLTSNLGQIKATMAQESLAYNNLDMGIAPMGSRTPGSVIRNQRFNESTMGLVQGLWGGRH